MGFYLRKGFRLGPLRVNLSKSGVGMSAGVKGARVGIDAKGKSYVHAGRGGLYFRKTLGAVGENAPGAATRLPARRWLVLLAVLAALVTVVLLMR
jgi:hypothetical protein